MINIKKEQLDFLDWEMGVFFHFGIRTFYEGHADWDGKPMPVEGFNPTELDCENWIKTVKEQNTLFLYVSTMTALQTGLQSIPSILSRMPLGRTVKVTL